MRLQPMDPSSLDQPVLVDVRGEGEWIVSVPASDRSLHIFRLAPSDWLVSEVGRANEGRGTDLKQALAALSNGAPTPDWWRLVVGTLDPGEESRRHPT